MGNSEQYQSHLQDVKHHSTETVGGIKKVEALGAMKHSSGGTMSLAALDDMHQATGRDLNQVVGKKLNVAVQGDMSERIAGLRESVTQGSQRLIASKNHIGSGNVNLFQVVVDLLDLVEQMNTQIATHVHPQVGQLPGNAAAFTANASKAAIQSAMVGSVTL